MAADITERLRWRSETSPLFDNELLTEARDEILRLRASLAEAQARRSVVTNARALAARLRDEELYVDACDEAAAALETLDTALGLLREFYNDPTLPGDLNTRIREFLAAHKETNSA